MRQSVSLSCCEPVDTSDGGHDEGADAMPNGTKAQLLRSRFPTVESAARTHQHGLGFFGLAVQGSDSQMSLTGVPGDPGEQQRAVVIASSRALGCARRTNRLHQL